MVGPDQFKSGHALEEGELALGPEIRLDVVQDRALLAAAARFDTSPHVPGVKDPSQIFFGACSLPYRSKWMAEGNVRAVSAHIW